MKPFEVLCHDSDEEEWRRLRWEGLTASMVPKLLGQVKYEKRDQRVVVSEYAKRVDSFEVRLAELEREGDIEKAIELRAVTETGKQMELHFIEWAARLNGWTNVRQEHALICRPGEPWLKASLDSWVTDVDGVEALIECKLHSPFVKKDWWTDEKFVTDRKPRPPIYVRTQALLELHLSQAPRIYVINWHWGALPRAHRVDPAEGEIETLLRRCSALWGQIEAERAEKSAACDECGEVASTVLDDDLGRRNLCIFCAGTVD